MGSVVGSLFATVGVTVAGAALFALVQASGLAGPGPSVDQVMTFTLAFLAGVFTFGYGVGKRATY